MTPDAPEAHTAPDIAAVDELRFLADAIRRVDTAAGAAHLSLIHI